MEYPETRRDDLVEEIHGFKVKDPYRWLESDDPEVEFWTDAQNRLADKTIDKRLRTVFEKELRKSYGFTASYMPRKREDSYFFAERQPGQDQAVLYVKKGLNGKKRALIDPNALSVDKIISLDFWSPSKTGRYLAYGTSLSGNELSELKVMDVASGKDIQTLAPNASWSDIAWLPDDSGLFYTRFPAPGSVPAGQERLNNRVCFRALLSQEEEVIFGEGRHKEEMYGVGLSPDGDRLVIYSRRDWVKNDLYLYDTRTKSLSDLIVGLKGWFSLALTPKGAFLYTNHHAPNGKILHAPSGGTPGSLEEWKELIPEGQNKLEWMQMSEDKLLLTYLVDAAQRAYTYDFSGKRLGELPMPENSSIIGISCDSEEAEFFYEYVSFITPGVTMRFDPASGEYTEYDRMGAAIDPKDYEARQEWFSSKDGTKVPIFVVYRKNLKKDGSNPAMLDGYGGFEVSNTPGYLRYLTPWLSRGGVYAVANIRGGGEFGKNWHTDGILDKKQNSYDDFIAAAEHLIEEGYTSSAHLGITGASNGGLLVSAVAVQRPELFKAVNAGVPLADMVRFPLSLIAGRWISEYGDPDIKKDLANILGFSPYHNVKKGVEYPAFLLTTAMQDTRVHPLHARKMAAMLQSVNKRNPVLIFTDKSSGHLGSLTMQNFYKKEAMVLAFFAVQLGLTS